MKILQKSQAQQSQRAVKTDLTATTWLIKYAEVILATKLSQQNVITTRTITK
jgi:hypothetical protein